MAWMIMLYVVVFLLVVYVIAGLRVLVAWFAALTDATYYLDEGSGWQNWTWWVEDRYDFINELDEPMGIVFLASIPFITPFFELINVGLGVFWYFARKSQSEI